MSRIDEDHKAPHSSWMTRAGSVSLGLALVAGLGLALAGPSKAETLTVSDGVEALGVIATGANGGSATNWKAPNAVQNAPGGTGAVVTAVVSSGFTPGDSIETEVGTGGSGLAYDWNGGSGGENAGGGGLTLVRNATASVDLVIAGGGGGASNGVQAGGDAGANPTGAGGDGAGADAANGGKGGDSGTGGEAGTVTSGAMCAGQQGGTSVNGGVSGYASDWAEAPGTLGATGSSGGGYGNSVNYYKCGGSGGAGYGGGGGGGSKRIPSCGEATCDFGGGGGAGGSFAIDDERSFEQHSENESLLGGPGLDGDVLVTWLSQPTVSTTLGAPGEVDLVWTTSTLSTHTDRVGSVEYEVYRDGEKVHTTSETSYTDTTGAGTHVYKIRSRAPFLNNANATVGHISTMGEPVTSPNVVPPSPSIETPLEPTSVKVTGGPKSANRVVKWTAPSTANGLRPVEYYRVKLKRAGCSKLIFNQRLDERATSYKIKRSLLLNNMTCGKSIRGDMGPTQARFIAKIEAFNSAGSGPIASERFLVRR